MELQLKKCRKYLKSEPLSQIEGQNILEARLKGLIPFAPLMKPPEKMDSKTGLRQCVDVAQTIPMDEADKPDYLASIAILSDMILDFFDIRNIFSEETMQETSFAQYLLRKLKEKIPLNYLLMY